MQQFSEELDRLLGDYGLGRGSLVPSVSSLAPMVESGFDKLTAMAAQKWSPQIEVFKRKNQLIIRADLPGLTKADVDIDITSDAVVIRGERKSARETNRVTDEAEYYRSERSYGSFYRRIALAAGASAERATTTLRNGVLEIKIPDRVSEARSTGKKEKSRSRTKTAASTITPARGSAHSQR
jgi:HSP20 family protein